jgi:hypothetical protein
MLFEHKRHAISSVLGPHQHHIDNSIFLLRLLPSVYLLIMVYAIADANEYLEDVKITKKAWVWPFQRCSRISVLPDDYSSKKISRT